MNFFIQTLIIIAVISGTFGGGFAFVKKVLSTVHVESAKKTDYLLLNAKYQALLSQWNSLVTKINSKGGMALIDGTVRSELKLTTTDIKAMLTLCHPDKHKGSKVAEEITRKLLEMRKS